jgi:hypothetical protein
MNKLFRMSVYLVVFLFLVAIETAPTWAVVAACSGDLPTSIDGVNVGTGCMGNATMACPSGCNNTNPIASRNCQTPVIGAPTPSITQQSDGTYTARWTFDIKAPGNYSGSMDNPGGALQVIWFDTPTAGGCESGGMTTCPQYGSSDEEITFYQQTGLTCAGAPYTFGPYALRAQTCLGPCFSACSPSVPTYTDKNGLIFMVTKAMLPGCPEPPKSSCCDNLDCKTCKSAGSGGTSVGGGGACTVVKDSGPGAIFRYRAGGVGGSGWPGTGPWNQRLGRYWSHDHAERIVVDPDTSHVWLSLEALPPPARVCGPTEATLPRTSIASSPTMIRRRAGPAAGSFWTWTAR